MVKKKLYRSNKNIMVAGVLAGGAEYFEQDPTIWRLGFVAFLVLTGFMPGVLLYVLAWIIVPQRGSQMDDVNYTVVE